MRVLVLGGDGYCGWPTALHLAARGHDISILDNFARRLWDHELGCEHIGIEGVASEGPHAVSAVNLSEANVALVQMPRDATLKVGQDPVEPAPHARLVAGDRQDADPEREEDDKVNDAIDGDQAQYHLVA